MAIYSRYDRDSIIIHNDAVYFAANNGTLGSELWVFDGENAEIVDDLYMGSSGSKPYNLISFQRNLYFTANTPQFGRELYRFDGNSISLVADIAQGPPSSNPTGLAVAGGALYFMANDRLRGQELWRFDGNTVSLVDDRNAGFQDGVEECCFQYNGGILLSGHDPSIGDDRARPLFYDGQNFTPIIGSGFENSPVIDLDGVTFRGNYYMSGGSSTSDSTIWRYNGTEAFPINLPLTDGQSANWSEPRDYAVFEDKLYFSARTTYVQPYRSLLSFDGEVIKFVGADISSFIPDPTFLTVFDGRLFLAVHSTFNGGDNYEDNELYVFDGDDLAVFIEINEKFLNGAGISSDPGPFAANHNIRLFPDQPRNPFTSRPKSKLEKGLYFYANDGIYGRELWGYKRTKVLIVNAKVTEILSKPWLWQVGKSDQLNKELMAATFSVEPDRINLINRTSVTLKSALEDPSALTVEFPLSDEKEEIGFMTVFFDRETRKPIYHGTSIVRSVDTHSLRNLEVKADAYFQKLTYGDLLHMRPIE